ncbi:hypothetical protein EXIGLDRAFT_782574 [Exidia glandulosa HHB12029]|uniref:F-box domain-containing protein n=1 Tax=Exidia glandulosa HHB12029 TaxID=1314781 RepID=A0A166NKM6_EXIGL|nr:hypothetical protein EXIGLDRAFT_782574 [Exidia glandulosa HHB12029]
MGTCVYVRRADLPGDEFWTVTTLRDAAYKEARRLVSRPCPFSPPAMHVPNELLSKIAACLPLRDRCQAVYTSRQWRNAFLTTPFVWDHLEILFFTKNRDGYRNWVALMQLLLKRNAGRPLTLDFEVFPTPTTRPSRAALERVYDLIALHMPHMKSLSLAISSAHDLPIFDVHAPILETLRVKIGGIEDDEHMPVTLFGGIAPRLSTLYLRCIDLPRDPCPALRSVENLLFHDQNEITDAFVFDVATGFPSLTTLTVTTDDGFAADGLGSPVFSRTRNVVSLRLNSRRDADRSPHVMRSSTSDFD